MKRLTIVLIGIVLFYAVLIPGELVAKEQLLEKVRKYRDGNQHAIINEFFKLLSIPNVALDKPNIRKNAALIKDMMEKRGIQVQILETPGNPVVFGELNVENAVRTLLFYVHYDGQPVDPSKWVGHKPFEPVLRPGKLAAGSTEPRPIPLPKEGTPFDPEWRIYGRSTGDDKAPVIALLAAIDAIRAGGIALNNNIKFMLDGEEEAGSPNLPYALEKYGHLLKADILFMCDGPAYFSGDPTLFFGVRGITSVSITVYGADTSLHSGHFGNWAPNPAMRLAQLLAGMKDKSGKVVIKGFYDTTTPLSDREKKALAAVPAYDTELMKLYGFSGAEGGGMRLLETIMHPSLNVNGLSSGWVGKDARTIVPASAVASIDIRQAKGNQPKDLVQKVIAHIKAQGYHVVDKDPDRETRARYPFIAKVVQEEKGYRAARTSMDLPLSLSVINALSGYSDKDPVLLPTLGGSLPIYIFEDYLKIPVIGVPIANHDNNQHQPNENLRIGNLWRAIETFAAILTID